VDKYSERWLSYYPTRQHKRRLAALARFAEVVKEEPAELLERARRGQSEGRDPEEVEDALRKYYKSLIDAKRAPSTAAQWYAVLRSYFTRNYVSLSRFPHDIEVAEPAYPRGDVLSQEQVRKMVETRDSKRDQLVIAFLAQTGQRIGVLAAMKRNMIKKMTWKGDPYGLVEVGPNLENPKGQNVNKYKVHYQFVIGKDTMKLIRQVKSKGGWLLNVSIRQMGRIVDEAAKKVGAQQPIGTKLDGRNLHTVHPHVFRKYWKRQVKAGGVKDRDMLDFMMAHKLPYGGAYDAFPDEDLLRAYRKAERKLRVFRDKKK
jgi:integrase